MSAPIQGSAFERAGLAALAAQLLSEAAGATVRARTLLKLADVAGAGAVPKALDRAVRELAECRIVVDARLDALQAVLAGDQSESDAARLAADDALASLKAREPSGG